MAVDRDSRPVMLERTFSKAEPPDWHGLSPYERGEFLVDVQENVMDQMHRDDKPHLKFTCDYDLERLLDKYHDILFAFEDWTQDQINMILKCCPQVLVTLLMSSAFTFIPSIRDLFFKRGDTPLGRPLITDNDLWIKDRADTSSPALSPDQNEFLRKLPFDVKNNFLAKQYEFRPFKIKEPNPNVPLRVPEKVRLPFKYQEDNIGVGGYGYVSKVKVAHKYFVRADRTVFEDDEECALKRIEVKEDFLEEVQTLSILKESWTQHARVLRHHVSFTHGKTFNILLQLAKHGNLETLLHEGFDPDGTQKYRVHEEFPLWSPGNPKSISDLINQFSSIADAVKFLHAGFKVGEQHVYLIHMDLKPDNILIMEDTATEASSVGKWMLSDFGISATKNVQSINEKSYIYTIGDAASKYDSHNTDISRTQARRPEGTYQAPEVRTDSDEPVGKKSDVWSLACIFSEVLAFGLGGSKYVQKFQKERKGRRRNDYFYVEGTSTLNGSLLPPGEGPRTFQVRASVIQYLESLAADHPDDWVNCCVRIVLNSLVPSMHERPAADHFKDQIEHAIAHYNNPTSHGGESCWVVHRISTGSSRGTSPQSLDIETPPSSSGGNPDIIFRPSVPRQESYRTGEQSELALHPSPPQEEIDRPVERTTTSPTSPRLFDKIFRPSMGTRRDSASSTSASSFSGSSKLMEGIAKFVDASICPEANNAVWLFDSCLYYTDAESFGTACERQPQQIIRLSRDTEWKQVASFHWIVGICGQDKQSPKQTILIYDLRNPHQPIQVPDFPTISHVSNIAISKSGLVVLTCMRHLRLYTLSRINTPGDDDSYLTLTPLQDLSNNDYRFTNVAFSSTGETIVAWSFGSGRVAISYWRFDAQHRIIATHTFSVQPSSTNRIHSLSVAPTSFPSLLLNGLEIVVRETDDSFFRTVLPIKHPQTSRDLPRKSVRLKSSGVMVACALLGSSHLVVLSRNGRMITKSYQIAVYPLLAGGKVISKDPLKEATVNSARERDWACAMQVLPTSPSSGDADADTDGTPRVVVLLQDGSTRVHRLYI